MNRGKLLKFMGFMMNAGESMKIQMCGDIALIYLIFFH